MIYRLKKNMLYIEIESINENSIQEFFDAYIPSSKIQHLLIQNKWIRIDEKPVKREDIIKGNHLIINIYPYSNMYKKTDYKIDVVYEDEFIIVVNKPKDILVHDDGNNQATLASYIESYFEGEPYIDVTPLHRLDYETSGLVVFSKSKIFQPLFDSLIESKKIRRKYLAFVEGEFEESNMLVDYPIGKDRHNSKKRIINKNGQKAITKLIKLASNSDVSIIRCVLETGRTHQIRLHLATIGYPILNDSLYGVKSNKIKRMGLIADELEFYHPLKEENVHLQTKLPNDLNKLYEEVNK